MTAIAELVAKVPKKHVRAVARALDLEEGTDWKREIPRALIDEQRLTATLDQLGDGSRGLLAGVVFAERAIEVPQYSYGRRGPSAPMLELERHGLLYAFDAGWSHHYVLPEELFEPVRAVLAARAARTVGDGAAERFVSAPLQTAHDAASLWAHLAREPARLKADGEVYVRVAPKLAAALAPLELADDEQARSGRVAAALRLLRDDGLVRVRVDDRPGGDGRRELVPAGDPARTLGSDPAQLRARLVARAQEAVEPDIAAALVQALVGRTVELASLAQALRALGEAAMGPLPRGWTAEAVALAGLAPLWHAGALELGTDARGVPIAVRCVPADPCAADGAVGVCQGNFEIVALRLPTPLERLELELIAERSGGQAHAFTLTRASVVAAARARRGPAGEDPAGRLSGLVGELPQNVARSIAGWTQAARTVALRSALVVDAGDAALAAELANGPLADLVATRLGEALLAIRADDLPAVERALAVAGVPLEPGLDRVSGRWAEGDAGSSRPAEAAWHPRADVRPGSSLARQARGRQVSTIGVEPAPVAEGVPATLLASLAELVNEGEPVELSLRSGGRYQSAVVTPTAIDGPRLLGWCEDCQQEHAFLLEAIEAVALA